ncbi:MAG TPA: hypothetical protein PK886_00240 [Candidatus Paceibacterota bacterium]|nr:hypothetical protein [Candidatus Paceibacterota bacterium]
MEQEPKNNDSATNTVEQDSGPREMMNMPDGTVADVTGKTPEEKREMLESYKNS